MNENIDICCDHDVQIYARHPITQQEKVYCMQIDYSHLHKTALSQYMKSYYANSELKLHGTLQFSFLISATSSKASIFLHYLINV